jgi:hypothetical protein
MSRSVVDNWQTSPAPWPISDASWKTYMGEACPHGLVLVMVDGTHVRNHYDSDFVQGGNGCRYDFIPKNELWIDDSLPEVEIPLVAFHECHEAELMRQGWTYCRAHDRAKLLEDRVRQQLRASR